SKKGARKTAAKKAENKATPTGPHTPISNVATEVTQAPKKLISLPDEGTAGGVIKPREAVEALRPEVVMETAAAPVPPAKNLVDIGAASFREGITLETVHGEDNRIQVQETNKYPYRINASLLITARDGSQWIGTGWFIGNRTLITAGHCVYITNS